MVAPLSGKRWPTKAFVLCDEHIMLMFYGMRNIGIELIFFRRKAAVTYAVIALT
jgi:hypothetical protein